MHQRQFKKGQVLPMSNLFDSIFNNATATVDPVRLMLALLVSLVLGMALSWTYKYRTLYTREFIVSLTLLPCMMTLVIFLVNGSLGTSIAVAGTFSLIRFRSATSGSSRIDRDFLAIDYWFGSWLGLPLISSFVYGLSVSIWLLLETKQSKTDHQRRRHLTIELENQARIADRISHLLERNCTEVDLISVNTSQNGGQLTLDYEVDLRPEVDEFCNDDPLTEEIYHCDVTLTKKAKKRKNL